MCLAVVALRAHPRYAVVLAANRDEFYARAATPLARWKEGAGPELLAGRDLMAGGTWLGVAKTGRWAFVTNVREPGRNDPAAPTRGALVPRVLRDSAPVTSAVASIAAERARYNGFNLIAGDGSAAIWYSNRADAVRGLDPGVHGISNARLDTPWPKVLRLRDGMSAWVARGEDDPEPLFDLLADRRIAPDSELPATGVSLDWERALSAPFIITERYGTRCSSVITITCEGQVRFRERSFDRQGSPVADVEESFVIAPG